MTLSEFTLSRRVTVIMLVLGIVLLGFIAIARIPQQLFPPITFPQISVVTEYPNAAPEEIEALITKPIEETLGSVGGLRRMESVSREGKSLISISFSWGTDIDFAALAVREKIDLVKEKLPKESQDPQVLKFDPLAKPVMILSVTGSLELMDLKYIAEKTLKDNLEKVEGVASASLSGGLDRHILVEVDQGRLLASKLSLLGISEKLEQTNLSYPAGSIKKGLYEYLIRTVGEFKKVEEIPFVVAGIEQKDQSQQKETSFLERSSSFSARDTVEGERDKSRRGVVRKRLIYFQDISQVNDTFKDVSSISRYNSLPNISLSIQKQAEANTIKVAERIRDTLLILREELESRDVDVEIIYDGSIFIKASIQDVVNNAWQGGLLAFIVLLIALRNFITSFAVVLIIPVTVMGVFFLMFARGITFNMMSLAGVALGIGMVIDNGIVLIENIFRLRVEGKEAREATVEGTEEVMWPIVSSSLTNIAVFFPLIIFVPGVAGQLFKDLSWTVIFSLVVAIFAALFIIPLFAVKIKLNDKQLNPNKEPNNLMKKVNSFQESICSKSPKKQNMIFGSFVIASFFLFFIGTQILGSLPQEVLPKVDQGQFLVKVDMPVGTTISATDELVEILEKVVSAHPLVEKMAVSIGSSADSGGGAEGLRASQAQILINLNSERKVPSSYVIEEIRAEVLKLDVKGAEVQFIAGESEFAFAAGGSKPIVVEVKGYDLKRLAELTSQVKDILGSKEEIIAITDDLGKSSPETRIIIDKKKAALYGISARDISLTAKAAIEGMVPTKFKSEGREFDIRVQLRAEDREDLSTLSSLLIKSNVIDAMVPLKEVATLEVGRGPSEIRRKDQQRTVTVTADLIKEADKKEVISYIEMELDKIQLEEGYFVAPAGEAKEVQESFQKIIFALVLAIVLVYMIMAAQFESFIQPLIIMFTVPLSIFGVSVALFLAGKSVNVIVLLGIVMLGGIVVNNGIVLIEYINNLREKGMGVVESAITAAKVRARPIMLTAATSAMGLVPMAIGTGEGAELRAPLAIVVMGGLVSSTVFSLFVVPSLYVLVTRLTNLILGQPEDFDDELEEDEDYEETEETTTSV